jgi:outer membrane protein OmpA-like peptidoglycan-associated protein
VGRKLDGCLEALTLVRIPRVHPPRMTNPRGSHLMLGVALVVGGYSLLLLALEMQAYQSATAHRGVPPDGAAALVPSAPAAATAALPGAQASAPSGPNNAAAPASAGAPAGTDEAASAGPAGAVVPAAATAGAAASDDSEAKGVYLFHFNAGGASMTKEEVQRLLVLAKLLAKHKDVRVSIDGFPDRSGGDPLVVGIARHRAKVGQLLLTQAGVKEDRITAAAAAELGTKGDLARTIRVTTTPPLTETDQP